MNGWLLQIIVFIFLAVVLLLISRPYARKLRNKKTYITEQESLLNKEGKVIRGGEAGKIITVSIDGSIWSAICNQQVNMGDIVQVIAIDSVILKVVLFK